MAVRPHLAAAAALATALPGALTTALPLLGAPTAPVSDLGLDDRRSLEQLLAEARAERERIQAELQPKVAAAVASLDELDRRARNERAGRIVDELTGLGTDVAPLLVQYLDPGPSASQAQVFRSERVADALARLAAVSVTDALLERAQTGSLVGRLNALSVLSYSPEPERVAPVLESIARATPDEATNPFRPVRLAALRALARLGGPAAATILAETLRNGDLTAAEGALDALIEVRLARASADVVKLLGTPRGAALASRIATYLTVVPGALSTEADVASAIRLCAQDGVSREAKLALLDVLRRGDHKPPSAAKRELQTLRESLDQGVREAALVYLARHRDRAAKKELFDPVDAGIRENRDAATAFEARARLHYLIGDQSAAVRDWRDALKAHDTQRSGHTPPAPFIGLARSLALLGKYKEASEYLDKAPISQTALQELAADPDFAAMRTSKYGDVFRVPSGESSER